MGFALTGTGDEHVHVRQNVRMKGGQEQRTNLLEFSVPQTTSWATSILPMPNTIPSIKTGADALLYRDEIVKASGRDDLQVVMCIKAIEGFTTPQVIAEAKAAGVAAIKIYFEGVTTNANHGDAVTWDGFFQMIDVWEACEVHDMVICIHPERPAVFSLERELHAHEAIRWLRRACPKVRISVEHITDRRTITLVKSLGPNTIGTITAHHLWGDLDMVIGGNLDPHSFCKPIAKTPEDLEALRQVVLSGDPQFIFGSDSAPHPEHDKEHEGCAGCFTGPYCLQMVAHILYPHCKSEGQLRRIMQGFMGDFAMKFYRLKPQGRRIYLVKEPFTIPKRLETSTGVPIIPFRGGKVLDWSIEA